MTDALPSIARDFAFLVNKADADADVGFAIIKVYRRQLVLHPKTIPRMDSTRLAKCDSDKTIPLFEY